MSASQYRRGFTIIEVILFLAVGSLLAVGLMAGTGATISAQRYKDTVVSLQSDIQQLFESTLAVRNDRADTTNPSGCTAGKQGQGDCVILGQALTISETGVLTRYDVLGTEPSSATTLPSNELQVLILYAPQAIATGETDSIEWGGRIAWPPAHPQAGTSRAMTILVVRSPVTGVIQTFSRDGANVTALSDMIRESVTSDPSGVNYGRDQRTICVDSGGGVINEPLAVYINGLSSTASDVEVRTNKQLVGVAC